MKPGLPDPARGEFNDAIRRVRSRGLQAARVVSLPAIHRVIPARGFVTHSDLHTSPASECAADSFERENPLFEHRYQRGLKLSREAGRHMKLIPTAPPL